MGGDSSLSLSLSVRRRYSASVPSTRISATRREIDKYFRERFIIASYACNKYTFHRKMMRIMILIVMMVMRFLSNYVIFYPRWYRAYVQDYLASNSLLVYARSSVPLSFLVARLQGTRHARRRLYWQHKFSLGCLSDSWSLCCARFARGW